MNELKEICDRLNGGYQPEVRYEVVRAEKTENSWNLTVQRVAEKKDGGAADESDK